MTKIQVASSKLQASLNKSIPNLRHLKFVTCYLLLVTFYLLLAPNTFSQTQTQTTIGISPSIINITLSPGKIYSYVVSVKNLSKVPIPISARIDTFTDLDGSKNYSVNSLSKWLKISPSDSIIPPSTTKKFNLTVTIPKSITLGGYYASISFTPLSPRTIKKDTQVQSQIVILALANIGAPRATAENGLITNWHTRLFSTTDSINATSFAVKNNSLYHYTAKPILTFESIFGSQKKFLIDEKVILPGRERVWENVLNFDEVNPGFYKVRLNVSVGEGVSVAQERFIVLLPSHKWIIITLLVLIIAIIFLARNKIHLLSALKALLDTSQK